VIGAAKFRAMVKAVIGLLLLIITWYKSSHTEGQTKPQSYAAVGRQAIATIHHFTDNPNIQNQAVSGKPLPPLKRTD